MYYLWLFTKYSPSSFAWPWTWPLTWPLERVNSNVNMSNRKYKFSTDNWTVKVVHKSVVSTDNWTVTVKVAHKSVVSTDNWTVTVKVAHKSVVSTDNWTVIVKVAHKSVAVCQIFDKFNKIQNVLTWKLKVKTKKERNGTARFDRNVWIYTGAIFFS